MAYLFTALLCLGLGWLGGWIVAHNTVATECEKLGKFYVGYKIYHCSQVEIKKHD